MTADVYGPEISDLIVAHDPDTLERLPVRRDHVMDALAARGDRRAMRIVRALPARDGVLDADAVDRMLVSAHTELQRLHEEFLHCERLLRLLRPLVAALRATDTPGPYRIVDVGCGIGYVIRWLAARGGLGDDFELVGADYNSALVAEANRLAEGEQLRCRFVVQNAFTMEGPGAIYLSMGVLHHFRGEDLTRFFAQQNDALAFLHYDIQRSWLAPVGAWIFHMARMRLPLARHDGILSAVRAHPWDFLLERARRGAAQLDVSMYDVSRALFPILRVIHAVVGVQPHLRSAFVGQLGRDSRRLEPFV